MFPTRHFGSFLPTSRSRRFARFGAATLLCLSALRVQADDAATQPPNTPAIAIQIDAKADVHPISPLIYGVAHASTADLLALNAPLNRNGGNNTTRYNWKQNADNRGSDWFFESIGEDDATPGARGDTFIQNSKDAGAQAMLTVPIIDWIAKLGPNREKLPSFSVAKYGAQEKTDQWMPDAGNGAKADKSPIADNDPADANTRNSPEFQGEWFKHLIAKWGTSDKGGLKYYIMDNEPALWNGTHRDVQPVGVTMGDLVDKTIAYSAQVKAVDPKALVVGPEEWGWTGYIYSGFDAQQGAKVNWDSSKMPDRQKMGGMDAMPWYLKQLHSHDAATKQRSIDVFSLHIYPQGGEFGGDTSKEMQLRRNRSTRSLWDASYKDETWINDTVRLIPRMKEWVADNYPGLQSGITEYNWGAEDHINGATTQADILGIFGREGLDLATRWTTPGANTPTFKAMKLFRNPNDKKQGFGETSVRASVPNPDEVSAFASVRKQDKALTIIVVNKKLAETPDMSTHVALDLKGFKPKGAVQMWQLSAKNTIEKLADAKVKNGKLNTDLPNGSVTLFVVAAG